jgi:hypothetical protein
MRTLGAAILGLAVVVSSVAESGWPGLQLDWQIPFRHLVPAMSRETLLPVKTKPTLFLAAMAAFDAITLVKASSYNFC